MFFIARDCRPNRASASAVMHRPSVHRPSWVWSYQAAEPAPDLLVLAAVFAAGFDSVVEAVDEAAGVADSADDVFVVALLRLSVI